MQHRRRRREELGVGAVVEQEVPVGHLEEPAQHVALQVALPPLVGDEGRQRDGGEAERRGREQPPQAPGPERREPDGAPVGPLGDDQRGDQEAREREEGGDAEVAAPRPRVAPVEQQHDGHRDAADAVERRVVRHLRAGAGGPAAGPALAVAVVAAVAVAGTVPVARAVAGRERRLGRGGGSSLGRAGHAAGRNRREIGSLDVSHGRRLPRSASRTGGARRVPSDLKQSQGHEQVHEVAAPVGRPPQQSPRNRLDRPGRGCATPVVPAWSAAVTRK